jgi:hypothetical protein
MKSGIAQSVAELRARGDELSRWAADLIDAQWHDRLQDAELGLPASPRPGWVRVRAVVVVDGDGRWESFANAHRLNGGVCVHIAADVPVPKPVTVAGVVLTPDQAIKRA